MSNWKEFIFRKLTSRKFWFGLAGMVSGLVIIFGYADDTAETISGAIITIGSAVGYMLSEGMVDAYNLGQILTGAETIVTEIKDEIDREDGEQNGDITDTERGN